MSDVRRLFIRSHSLRQRKDSNDGKESRLKTIFLSRSARPGSKRSEIRDGLKGVLARYRSAVRTGSRRRTELLSAGQFEVEKCAPGAGADSWPSGGQ